MGGGVLLPNIIGYYIYLYFIFYFNFLLHILNPSFFPHHLNLHNRPDDDCVAGDEEVLLEGVDAEMEAEEIGTMKKSSIFGIIAQLDNDYNNNDYKEQREDNKGKQGGLGQEQEDRWGKDKHNNQI